MNKTAVGKAALMMATAKAVRSAVSRRADDLAGEVAVVTGASRGLGFVLANELAKNSCRLVICARDDEELRNAQGQLTAIGAEAHGVNLDLADPDAPQRLVDAAIERYGRIDILVNNAGVIKVGPVSNTTPADYEAALSIMTMAAVRASLAALPIMRHQQHGRIVTITSIGGKLSVPHLLPYSVAKSAAVAFSEGLRAELGSGPITVTTVVPGLMRTGSHLRAEFADQREEEFTWFSLGASLPLISMDAERAGRQIVAAIRARRSEIVLTPAGQVVARSAAIFPEATTAAMNLASRLLPDPAARPEAAAEGHRLRPAIAPGLFDRLTTLGRRAAVRFNETRRAGAVDT